MILGRKLFVGSFQLALLVVLLTVEFSGVDLTGLFDDIKSDSDFRVAPDFGSFSGVLYIFMEDTLVNGGLAGKFLVSISSFKKPLKLVELPAISALLQFATLSGVISVLKFVKLSRESSFKLMSSSLAPFNILADEQSKLRDPFIPFIHLCPLILHNLDNHNCKLSCFKSYFINLYRNFYLICSHL